MKIKMNKKLPLEVLEKYYGYSSFRGEQEKVISYVLKNKDVLAILPTGAGKSICYQIPALIFSGITLVISPLISLMKDQVEGLKKRKIKAVYINSNIGRTEQKKIEEEIENDIYKIIYVAPERLLNTNFFNVIKRKQISLIAIDEAHCISMWGHDFRKSYIKIDSFIKKLSTKPTVVALTASATNHVKQDIISSLHLQSPVVIQSSFDRENLFFSVEKPYNKYEYIKEYIKKHKEEAGIIYCTTRNNVNHLYNKMFDEGYPVCKYHAGMSKEARIRNQDQFLKGRKPILIATNAFGMGIDKPDIRYILHYNMPMDMEGYYQEAGRAGRDGKRAECTLLFSTEDILINRELIKVGKTEKQLAIAEEKLSNMIFYCQTKQCLRKNILTYFNEQVIYDTCKNCGNCIEKTENKWITMMRKIKEQWLSLFS